MENIAILITCFNRKVNTIRCLEHINKINIRKDIYLVDDGSTDGTSDEVKLKFPDVNLIQGNGNLYWNRGMLLAWQTASKFNYDFYVWINDDVDIYSNAFEELFECSRIYNYKAIVSGIVETETSEIIYGGYDSNRKMIEANNEMNQIQFLNGNIVLVSRFVVNQIGLLDPIYHHDLGDIDYGLRAIKANIPVISTKKAIAKGERNSICRERLNYSNLFKRFKRLYYPLGSNPKINFYFRRKHKSFYNALGYFLFQHFLNLIPDNLNQALFKDKYQ